MWRILKPKDKPATTKVFLIKFDLGKAGYLMFGFIWLIVAVGLGYSGFSLVSEAGY